MNITIVNVSTAVPDADVAASMRDFQAWVDEDLGPAWKLPKTTLMLASAGDAVSMFSTPLYILDHADRPGVLGYHEDVNGIVDGKCFAGDAIADGVSWTVDLTHELGEMLVNPTTLTLRRLSDGRWIPQEACDAVESDLCAYKKGDTLVSDFALPSYFSGAEAPWDFQGHLGGPAPTLTEGGYANISDGTSWSQIFAALANGALSDRARRRISRTAWIRGR